VPGGSLRPWLRFVLGVRLAASWRPTGTRVRGLLRSLLTSFVALGATLWILAPLRASGPFSILVLALSVAAVGALLRPVLFVIGLLAGPIGLLLIGIVSQAIVLDIALSITPGVHGTGLTDVLLASWIVAGIVAIINWLLDSGSEDAYFAQLLGRAIRIDQLQVGRGAGGLLIVQLDGVGESVLRQAINAGSVPTLSRWLRSGEHTLRGWHTGLPSTTPAAQAILLHGDSHEVPSFRWYEKESGRLMVANRPHDAAEIEARISTGRGLLADGGVSVSNLFSGDAATTLLTMSNPALPASRSTRGLTTFVTSRGGLSQSLVKFVGVMLTELQQSRRQRRRKVAPAVRRGGVFVLLRAVTTVLLRDFDVAMVIEQMARGAPVIFVDFVDYDEVAHHAGPTRPESMRTLDGLDRVLGLLESVATAITPNYEIVVLSDHGQAQGSTFSQLTGMTLGAFVSELAGSPSGGADARPAERWGAATVLANSAPGSPRRIVTALARVLTRREEVGVHDAATRIVVAASGSLAHLYLPELPGRASAESITERMPGLIEGLHRQPYIGTVLRRSDANGLVVSAGCGWRVLRDGHAVGGAGENPLTPYGRWAAADLISLDARAHVGDLVLLGAVDPRTGEVAAFEELVGSHGGLGGDQSSAILIHPASWPASSQPELDGSDVHEMLLERLRQLRLRPGDSTVAAAQS
jgi:uncharacterized membrane protein YvlD (DUF360 family)